MSDIPDICAAIAEADHFIHKLTVGISCDEDAAYFEPEIAVLEQVQSRLLGALAKQPIDTTADAAAIARLALQLTETSPAGLFIPQGVDWLYWRVAEWCAGASLGLGGAVAHLAPIIDIHTLYTLTPLCHI
jgi:hypothetical protein